MRAKGPTPQETRDWAAIKIRQLEADLWDLATEVMTGSHRKARNIVRDRKIVWSVSEAKKD